MPTVNKGKRAKIKWRQNISLYTVIIHDGIDILVTFGFIIHVHEITLAHRFIDHSNTRMPLDFLLSCYLYRVVYTSCKFCLSSFVIIFLISWIPLDTVVIKKTSDIRRNWNSPSLKCVRWKRERKGWKNKCGQIFQYTVYSPSTLNLR